MSDGRTFKRVELPTDLSETNISCNKYPSDICYNIERVVSNIRWIFVTSDISYSWKLYPLKFFHLTFVTTLLPANAKSDDHESANHQLSSTTLSSIPESNLSIIKRNYRTNERPPSQIVQPNKYSTQIPPNTDPIKYPNNPTQEVSTCSRPIRSGKTLPIRWVPPMMVDPNIQTTKQNSARLKEVVHPNRGNFYWPVRVHPPTRA